MPSVTIDAGVLAAPSEHCSPEDAHRYVETILDWSRLLDERWVTIYMSERASEALFGDGLFPLRDQLKRLFDANGIIEYTINDLITVVNRLLQLTPSFEAYFSIQDVLTEELTTEPDILQLCSGTRLQSDLARCIVLIAILRRHCREDASDHSLILRRAPDTIIRVRALIQVLQHERTDIATIPVPPEYFEGDVLVCDDFRGLVECLDEATILLNATDDVGIETAIRIAVCKSRLSRGQSPEWDDVPVHRVGHQLYLSLQGLRPTQQLATKLIRAIVETLERTNMEATHGLRIGRGGNAPQRVRESDNAHAWRRDVDHEYHLHYWVLPGGSPELASVNVHNDFSIPE